MPSFIPEEVSHCWDLWRYPGCGAINRMCFPLTKTCQHSSSLTWICFFAWRLRKCLCPLSAETSQLLALVSLLTTGDIFLNLAHISDFFFLYKEHLSLGIFPCLPSPPFAFIAGLCFSQVFWLLLCNSFCSSHSSAIIHTARCLCKLLWLNGLLVKLFYGLKAAALLFLLFALSCIHMMPFSALKPSSTNKHRRVSLHLLILLWAGLDW